MKFPPPTGSPFGFPRLPRIPLPPPQAAPDAGMRGTIQVDLPELAGAARELEGDATAAARLSTAVTSAGCVDMPPEVAGRVKALVGQASRALHGVENGLRDLADMVTTFASLVRRFDDALLADLITSTSPVLQFHPDERNWLEDPLRFIRNSSLRHHRSWGPDDELYGRGKVPPEVLAGIRAHHVFLDLDDGKRGGDNRRARNLVQYDPKSGTITYWLFYAHNDGFDVQNHEGDWEQVTVALDRRTGRPRKIRYSGHGDATERDWEDAPKDRRTGRPVSYVARGSHANYPGPGSWRTAFLDVRDSAQTGGRRFDTLDAPAVDITREPYYGGGNGWGERGDAA
ncbi:MAG TPA: hypothetical protein VF244_01405, partial [Acidimicrobiales bacterium]